MSEIETTDAIDRLLEGHCRPEPLPGPLARRIVESARAVAPAAEGRDAIAALLGRLTFRATERGVAAIDLDRPDAGPLVAGRVARRIAERAREEMAEYLAGARSFFGVPLDLSTVAPFQREVLDAAAEIPFGEARSYSWIAARIGRPGARRAVGTALGRNPVPFIVPCHRVLRSDGSLGGYALGLPLKTRLLDLERRTPLIEGNAANGFVCRTGCAGLRAVLAHDRVSFVTLDDAREIGYRPCRECLPGLA